MSELKVLFADDEIPDKESFGKKIKKKIPDEKSLEEELRKPIYQREYSLWKHKIALKNISKLTDTNNYEVAKKFARDKQFDIAIIDLHWGKDKEAGFEICRVLENKNSSSFKIVYSSRLKEDPELRKKIIDINAFPLHKNYNFKDFEDEVKNSIDQLKSVINFVEKFQNQDTQIKIIERKAKNKKINTNLDALQNQQKWYFRIMNAMWISFIFYFFFQIFIIGLSDEIKYAIDGFTVLVGTTLYKLINSNQKEIKSMLLEEM